MTMSELHLTCDACAEALGEYLEGDASIAMRSAVDRHVAGCTECAALLVDLRGITSAAGALPLLAPSRDLWSGIADRIDTPVVALGDRAAFVSVRRRWYAHPALVAAALVGVTAGVTHVLTRASLAPVSNEQRLASAPTVVTPGVVVAAGDSGRESAGAATVAAPSQGSASSGLSRVDLVTGAASGVMQPRAVQSPVRQWRPTGALLASASVPAFASHAGDPVYGTEIARLRQIVAERKSQLDPATVAVLEQSITVIDSAIAQSRAALAKDPASGMLATQLNHSLEKKVELLRTVATLPSAL